LPDALTLFGEQGGSSFEDLDRVGQKLAGFVGRGGQPVDARRPRAEFHALPEVDGPDDHVLACGQVAHHDVKAAALAGAGRAAEEDMSPEEEHAAGSGVFERAEIDRLGDRVGRRAEPWDGSGVRIDVENAEFASLGQGVARAPAMGTSSER
jgi:hypothetical protein